MSAPPAILSMFDSGLPILLGGDPVASLRALGTPLEGVAPLGKVIREKPASATEHYKREVASGVDVLLALTSDTMPRALAHVGMAFRAAALTRCAVELALDAASSAGRSITIAGVLGNRSIESTVIERIMEECATHAARLVTSGCELIIARGFAQAASSPASLARAARVASVSSALATRLPTWAAVDLEKADETPDGQSIEECAGALVNAGAQLLLLEVPTVEVGVGAMKRVRSAWSGAKIGVLLAASGGPPLDTISIDAWATAAKRLTQEGAHAIGGGAGTTADHVAALAGALHVDA